MTDGAEPALGGRTAEPPQSARAHVSIHRAMTESELQAVLHDKTRILSAEEIDPLLAAISGDEAVEQARKAAVRAPLFVLPDFDSRPHLS